MNHSSEQMPEQSRRPDRSGGADEAVAGSPPVRAMQSGEGERPGGTGGPRDPSRGRGGGRPPVPGAGPSRGLFGFVLLMLVIVMVLIVFNSFQRGDRITWAEFRDHLRAGQIDPASIVFRDTSVSARLVQEETGTEKRVEVPHLPGEVPTISGEIRELTGGAYRSQPPSGWQQFLLVFGPVILLLLIMWLLISRGLRAAGGGAGMLGSFGKSRHRTMSKEMTGVTFADVAGIEEAKEEVTEIIEFLKNPKRFTRIGGRIPRGVLLIGEPGCGKTLLAKAIAGEADVPFFSISGSDFVEMFVGVGASRVRDLFKQAKESAPCIVFLDEIDAVGRRRGGGFSSGGHDEREQTLNAILVEMDGFESTDGVIVIAATNRSDVLDPALTRPGRFDRQITVPLPDIKGRLEVLKVHASKVRLGPDVDLERIARGTAMFSGADLAAIINEGAIAATMANKDFIEHEDLEEARDKVKFGRSQRSRRIEQKEKVATAYHEAGHAVLQALLRDADPLHKVTIIPRGQALGATFSLPEKDRLGFGLKWLSATMVMACGGRIAEERQTGDVSSGASMDITQVTRMARAMVLEWGMSERLGFVRYAPVDTRESYLPDREYSERTAELIDHEIRRLVDEAYTEARRLLDANWEKVVGVAEALLRHESLTADEVHRIMRGETLGKPTIRDLLTGGSAGNHPGSQPGSQPGGKPSVSGGQPDADLPPGTLPAPA